MARVTMDERAALVALAHAAEPADLGVGRRVREASASRALTDILDGGTLRHVEGMRARLLASDWMSADEHAADAGARIITRVDPEWPTQLGDLGDAEPFALWVQGAASLRLACLRSVAIVGARACSAYGEEVSRSWAAELAGQSWTVVSGGAFGIDAAAHRGALAADGLTVCIQAGGVDRPYPRAHEALAARIADDGLLVSESPLGEGVRRQRFLSRNRLIAALTRATIVVEAAERSGTIATARAAGAMMRPVLAVPGPVSSPVSAGCHRMIRDGEALLVADVDEVLDLVDLAHVGARPSPAPAAGQDPIHARVLDALPGRGPIGLAALVQSTALDTRTIVAALDELCGTGRVLLDNGGWRLADR